MKNLDSSSCLVCQDYTRGLRGRYIGVLAFVEDGHARSSRRTGAAHRLASPLLCGRENRVVVPTPAGHVVSAGTLAQPVGGVRAAVSCRRPHRAMALQEKEERIRQRHPERKDLREAALNEMQCPHCGAAVNPVTADGLHSPEAEPWLLICNQYQGRIEPDV